MQPTLVGQFWETYEIGKGSSPPQSISSDQDECDNDNADDADDADKGYGQDNDLVRCGVPSRRFCRKRDSFKEDRNIRRALPEMDNTLSNWTLHGKNLRKMLRNYKTVSKPTFRSSQRARSFL